MFPTTIRHVPDQPLPRANVRFTTSCDGGWGYRAVFKASDFEPFPTGECQPQWIAEDEIGEPLYTCTERNPCPHCYAVAEWVGDVAGAFARISNTRPYARQSGPGGPFATMPDAWPVVRHPGVIYFTWGGGLDV